MLKNLKLGIKLGMGFGLLILLSVIVAGVSLWGMEAVKARVTTLEEMEAIVSLVHEARRQEKNFMLRGDQESLNKHAEALAGIAEIAAELRANVAEDNIPKIDNGVRATQAYEAAFKAYVASATRGGDTLADGRLEEEMVRTGQEVMEIAEDLGVFEQELLDSNVAQTLVITMTCAALALVLGIGAAIFLTGAVTKPVRRVVSLAQAMSEGDFTQELDGTRKDEFGVLARALNGMVAKLRSVVHDVREAMDNVALGGEMLAATTQSLSRGANEQAASIEEVSSSMEQMNANIRQNAENAQQTESIAQQAAADADEGGAAVRGTVEAMKNIAEKISIIEEIARQTNLLALNAAIEAARAGEHGKGFAVVAAEVRKLAERSGTAAAEISELSVSSVDVAEKAGQMLHKLVPDIRKTSELVQEIAASSAEQNSGADQINKAIQQLDHVIQQNASAAEQMASTSEEFSSQGQQMLETMRFFRMDNSTPGGGEAPKKVTVKRAQPKPLEAGRAQPKPKAAEARSSAPSNGVDLDLGGGDESDSDFERF